MSEGSGEKSFAPSGKRLDDAARRGDVLRSKDAGTAAAMVVGGAWLVLAGPGVLGQLEAIMRVAFVFDRRDLAAFSPEPLLLALLDLLLPAVLSLALPVIAASLLAQLVLGNGRWVVGNLAPKGRRIDPVAGLKRMFGASGLIEMGKGLLKTALLGGIAWGWWAVQGGTVMRLGHAPLAAQLATGWEMIVSLIAALTGGLIVIALFDLPLQWLRRQRRLKMTLQEVRDEHKESEGSPEMKAARRQRQREIAAGSVAGAMREAQFVITNPSHFAVALAYDPAKAGAPIVLAKGKGDKALAIKQIARERGVPALEYPQLARSVYYTSRERQVICEDLYGAIAAVLAYVLSLRRGETVARPEVAIPARLCFDVEGRVAVNTAAVPPS